MIGWQLRLDRDARRRRLRLQNFIDGSRRHGCRRLHGTEFAWSRGEMCLCRSRIRQFRFWLRRHRDARRGGLRRSSLRCRWRYRRRRNRLAANRAQIAFDHRQPIDHMAERIVDRFQGILGVAIGFNLAEAEIGQFTLDDIGHTTVR